MKEHINRSSKTILKTRAFHLICVIGLIVIDQLTKFFVRNELSSGKNINIIPKVLVLTFVKNTGAAFGFFENSAIPISILNIIILSVLIWFYLHIPNSRRFYPLSMIAIFITAGAVGNLLDRFINNYVTDFIYFEIIDFAVFNVADMYITISVFIMLFLTIFYYDETELNFVNIGKKGKKTDELLEDDNPK